MSDSLGGTNAKREVAKNPIGRTFCPLFILFRLFWRESLGFIMDSLNEVKNIR